MNHMYIYASFLPKIQFYSGNLEPFHQAVPTMRSSHLILLLTSLLVPVLAKIRYAGVSVSSGEFGVYSPGNPGYGLPGTFGVDYQFINKVSRCKRLPRHPLMHCFIERNRRPALARDKLVQDRILAREDVPTGIWARKQIQRDGEQPHVRLSTLLTPVQQHFEYYADAVNYITSRGAYVLTDVSHPDNDNKSAALMRVHTV